MEKNTKILLSVAAAGVVAYLILKPKKATAQTNSNVVSPSTKTDSKIIDDITGGLPKKIDSIDAKKVTNTTSTTTRTTTTPDVIRGTANSPYLKEGVEYISSGGVIAYGDEISGRFNSVDPSHGNPFSKVNSDPFFWEDTGVDWFWVPDDAFAGQGYGGRFSEDRQV